MNKLRITLTEDGSVKQFTPDFKLIRGSYRNVLINVEVPRSILIDPVTDGGVNQTGNNVRIGAIIRTATGQNLQTKRYELQWVKDYIDNDTEYSLYQRRMPKEFTLWETVNLLEATNSGVLELVINVVNWTLDGGTNAKIEEVATSQILTLDVYPSAFLTNAEEITSPTDFDKLQSQVQDINAEVDKALTDLYGTSENTLGTYIAPRLKAGNKINIEEDTSSAPNNRLKISVQTINANEVPITHIDNVTAADVQGALEEINAKTATEVINSVVGEDGYLVDNKDPLNPIVKHDRDKVDKSVMGTSETANGVVSSVTGDSYTDTDVDEMALHIKLRSIQDGSLLSDTAIPLKLASSISRGLMPKESVATLSDLVTRVASLEGKATRYIYTGTNPTANAIDAFVRAQGQTPPYEGVAVVVSQNYHVWHYYENDNIGWKDDGSDTVTQATNTSLGIVIGSTENGKIYVESNGSMSLVGFDGITGRLTSLENSKLDIENYNKANGYIRLDELGNIPEQYADMLGSSKLDIDNYNKAGGYIRLDDYIVRKLNENGK